jgi:pilus assembly protein CpaB
MRTRGMAVFLAVLLAAGATAAVFLYVRSVRDEAKSTTFAEGVEVIVAKQDIRGGTNLDNLISAGGFERKSFPRDLVVAGAVTDLAQLQHRTTSAFIAAGEQMTTARLSGSETPTGGVLNIPPGYTAVTLQMDSERNVAGFVSQGDHIQVFAALSPSGTQGAVTVTVVPDVEVLRIGGRSSEDTSSSSGDGALITLALLPKDAARVIEARETGNVWFSLLPPSEAGQNIKPVPAGQLLR